MVSQGRKLTKTYGLLQHLHFDVRKIKEKQGFSPYHLEDWKSSEDDDKDKD
ncbi:conserved hypothetical protein [Ricinus communis]|uniref:Uncharacterized protein n=1 Tax=Ricinus communis TaxID=3988 RepID=B9SQH0_RICCO|nr:conserved hypothetical protein [Ricinus communis]